VWSGSGSQVPGLSGKVALKDLLLTLRPTSLLEQPVVAWQNTHAVASARHAVRSKSTRKARVVCQIPAPLSPWGPSWNRSFGVELEFKSTLAKDDLFLRLIQRGHLCTFSNVTEGISQDYELTSKGGRRRTTTGSKAWTLHAERCIPGNVLFGTPKQGWEVASPILYGHAGLREVKKMCETLEEIGADVEEYGAGLHVHVGVTDLDGEGVSGLILAHHHLEEEIDGILTLVAPHRKNNMNCEQTAQGLVDRARKGPLNLAEARSLAQSEVSEFSMGMSSLNLIRGCPAFGTVEFRRHQTTAKFQEVLSWVLLCLSMVSESRSFTNSACGNNLQEGFTALGMFRNGELIEWAAKHLLERYNVNAKSKRAKLLETVLTYCAAYEDPKKEADRDIYIRMLGVDLFEGQDGKLSSPDEAEKVYEEAKKLQDPSWRVARKDELTETKAALAAARQNLAMLDSTFNEEWLES